LVRLAASQIEGGKRSRFREEWLAVLADTPGAFSKLIFAGGVLLAAEHWRARRSILVRVFRIGLLVETSSLIGMCWVLESAVNLEKLKGRSILSDYWTERFGECLNQVLHLARDTFGAARLNQKFVRGSSAARSLRTCAKAIRRLRTSYLELIDAPRAEVLTFRPRG
jgi:hypothetical protein